MNLWPGEYTFRVVARGAHGGWSEEASVQVRVLPMWWQTTAALVAAVLGVMAIGAALQRMRTESIRRRNIELQQEIYTRESAETELKGLSRRMITAQEDDRARIRDDGIGFDPDTRKSGLDPAVSRFTVLQRDEEDEAELWRGKTHAFRNL